MFPALRASPIPPPGPCRQPDKCLAAAHILAIRIRLAIAKESVCAQIYDDTLSWFMVIALASPHCLLQAKRTRHLIERYVAAWIGELETLDQSGWFSSACATGSLKISTIRLSALRLGAGSPYKRSSPRLDAR